MGTNYLLGTESQCGKMKKYQSRMAVMAAQCECALNATELHTKKMVNFVLRISGHTQKKLSREGKVPTRRVGGGRAGILVSQRPEGGARACKALSWAHAGTDRGQGKWVRGMTGNDVRGTGGGTRPGGLCEDGEAALRPVRGRFCKQLARADDGLDQAGGGWHGLFVARK